MPGIQSQSVILVEGDADEIAPNAKLAADMHGFVIMVPPSEGGERLLDMLWRITMAYAGMPSMLRGRKTVSKMVEAVWSKESRALKPARRPARKSGLADLTVARTGSLPGLNGTRKAKTRRET
jgi:hypothetical protein